MRVHYFQHVPFEGLAGIAEWMSEKGHVLSSTQWWAEATPPSLENVDWLVVMGGPMGVHDEDTIPWLRTEKQAIAAAIETGKRVLGVCLGAQLIAGVLGARVYPNRYKEIGWFPVKRSAGAEATRIGALFPEQVEVYHWHGDTFDLPAGCVRIAESEACRNQAFSCGERVLGLQFHLETTASSAESMVRSCRRELTGGPYIQTEAQILSDPGRYAKINALMRSLLDCLESARA